MNLVKSYFTIFICAFFLSAASLGAYPTVAGCPALTDGDFRSETLVSYYTDNDLGEITKVAVDVDASNQARVFFVERGNYATDYPARVKLYNEATNSISTIATMPSTVNTTFEDGLSGIVLDPDFKTNGWIYLFLNYSTFTAAEIGDGRLWNDKQGVFRVARYTFNGTTLDLGSETVIIDIPTYMARFHTSGDMSFDKFGNLWISVGDNTREPVDPNAEGSSACVNDLRGSILRIKPLPEGGYTVPEGNFASHFSSTIPEYADPNLASPEIFVKGIRNAYSITVHPTKPWVGWGDCGPDSGVVGEEHNFANAPGFYGFPYFLLDNQSRMGKDPNAPVNSSNLCDGASALPPTQPAAYYYGQSCAMGGALYVFDPDLNNSRKLPPQLNNQWFMGDWSLDNLHLKKIGATGVPEGGMENNPFSNVYVPSGMVDMNVGPDGAIYVVNYGHGYFITNETAAITRLVYTGTQEFSAECLANAGVESLVPVKGRHGYKPGSLDFANGILTLHRSGIESVNIYSVDGALVKSLNPAGATSLTLSDYIGKGVYFIQLMTAGQIPLARQKVVLL